jgi:toxin FitB
MIILDTDVLSTLMHPLPDRRILAWLNRQPRSSIWTTSITVFEVRFGFQSMPAGKRRSALTEAFELSLSDLDHRIADFDPAAASYAGELMALRNQTGRPMDLRDTMIAGIVVARHATLATRNTAHFSDISATVVNPWDA